MVLGDGMRDGCRAEHGASGIDGTCDVQGGVVGCRLQKRGNRYDGPWTRYTAHTSQMMNGV